MSAPNPFASAEQKPTMVVSFYSFKGGVGRSMALVNVAEILATCGYRVVVCDWDLEAPGLEQYLVEGSGGETFLSCPGIIDLVREYKEIMARPVAQAGSGVETPDPGPGFEKVGELYLRRPSTYAKELPGRVWGPRGWVRFLPAGRRDGEWEARYNLDVRTTNWTAFYADWAGGAYFEYLRLDLGRIADVILIDSRTGITELGGVATHHLADVVILMTAANRQNREGTDAMVESLTREGLVAERSNRPVVALPIASRIDTVTAARLEPPFMAAFIRRYLRLVPEEVGDAERFLRATRIPYAPEFSYEEKIVARMTREERSTDLYNPYEALAQGLERIGCSPKRRLLPMIEGRNAAGTDSLPSLAAKDPLPMPPPVVAMPRLEGTYFVAYPVTVSDEACAFVRTFRETEVKVWELCRGDGMSQQAPSPGDVVMGAAHAAGYLAIVPSDAEPAWLEAEINWMLRSQAIKEDFRAMLLLLGDPPPELPFRGRIATLSLVEIASSQAVHRIIAELLPSQLLVPEREPQQILDALHSPRERESRFFGGSTADLAEVFNLAGKVCAMSEGGLTIYGESGSGKSNLIWGALVPAIRRGWIGRGAAQWLVAGIKITTDAKTEIASALREALPQGSPNADADDIDESIRRLGLADRPLLLVIDSAEEIVAEPESREAEAVEEILTKLRRACGQRLMVAFGVRRDFFGRLSEGLPSWVRKDLSYDVRGISTKGREEFLRASARLLGVQYEPGLVELILREARDAGAILRTLGSLLAQLWLRRRNNLLTHAAYEAVGRLSGVLLVDATRLLQDPGERLAQPIRRILTNLVSAGSCTRMVADRTEVLAAAGGDDAASEALTQLISWNVVTLLDAQRLQLASDSFISNEPLATWLREDAAELKRQAQLAELATLWRERHKSDDLLLGETLLSEHVSRPLRTDVEREYLEASTQRVEAIHRNEQMRRKRKRVALAIVGSLLLLMLLLVAYSVFQKAVFKQRLNEQAGKERSRHYLRLADQNLAPRTTNPRASVFALFYLSIATRLDPENKRAVISTCQLLAGRNWCPPVTPPLRPSANSAPLLAATFTLDDRYVIAIGRDGRLFRWPSEGSADPVVRAWSKSRFEVLEPDSLGNPQLVDAAAFSPGGKHMLVEFAPAVGSPGPNPRGVEAVSRKAQVFTLGERSYEPGRPEFELRETFRTVAWGSDANTLVIVPAARDGASQVFRYEGGRYVEQSPGFQTNGITAAAFSPDGTLLATASVDGKIGLWDAESFAPAAEKRPVVRSLSGPKGAFMLIFGPGENELAEIIFGGPLRIWNLTNGQPRDIERQANEQLMRFVVDPAKTRERRIVASYGNRVVLSEPQSFKPIAEPICPQGSYSVPVFSSDGRKVLTLSGTFWTAFETVRVWRTDLPVASAEAKSVQFDGKSPPPWLPDLAEAVSGQRVTPDEESPWTNTLDAIAAKATPAEGQYKVIWERYFQPEASMKR